MGRLVMPCRVDGEVIACFDGEVIACFAPPSLSVSRVRGPSYSIDSPLQPLI